MQKWRWVGITGVLGFIMNIIVAVIYFIHMHDTVSISNKASASLSKWRMMLILCIFLLIIRILILMLNIFRRSQILSANGYRINRGVYYASIFNAVIFSITTCFNSSRFYTDPSYSVLMYVTISSLVCIYYICYLLLGDWITADEVVSNGFYTWDKFCGYQFVEDTNKLVLFFRKPGLHSVFRKRIQVTIDVSERGKIEEILKTIKNEEY